MGKTTNSLTRLHFLKGAISASVGLALTMNSFIICLCMLLFAGETALAGNKKHSKKPSTNNNNATTTNQQASPANSTTPPAPAPDSPPPAAVPAAVPVAVPVDPVLAATQRNIAELRADFIILNICTNDAAPADRKTSLLNDFKAAPQGTPPPEDSIHKLADQLLSATLGRNQMQAQDLTLARDIHAAFNGAHLTDAQRKLIFDEVKSILTDSGVPENDADAIVGNLQKIARETQ